jgi:hypothetical protein
MTIVVYPRQPESHEDTKVINIKILRVLRAFVAQISL